MKLRLEKKQEEVVVKKGDMLVYESKGGTKCHYLVVQKSESYNSQEYLVVNIRNAILFSLEADTTDELITLMNKRFHHMTFVEVIPADKLELNRI